MRENISHRMTIRTNRLKTVLITLAAALTIQTPLVRAAGYKLDWQTVDGGGGNCSGGKLSVSGTVGQPDAGNCAGGSFLQQGGFIPAFQKSLGPPLRTTFSGNQVINSWPNICPGFILEGAPNVNGPTWTALGSGTVLGADRQVLISKSSPYHFFRLQKNCP